MNGVLAAICLMKFVILPPPNLSSSNSHKAIPEQDQVCIAMETVTSSDLSVSLTSSHVV